MGRIQKLLMVILAQFTVLTAIGCGEQTTVPKFSGNEIYIKNVTFLPKKPDFGGEACVAMWLNTIGSSIDQDFVYDQAEVDPMQGRGCNTAELAKAVKKLSIDPGAVWFNVDPSNADQQFSQQLANLKTDIEANIPWVVCLETDEGQQFVLVVGIDPTNQEILYHNPNVREGSYRRMAFNNFRQSWALDNTDGTEFFVKLRMQQPRQPINATASTAFTDADYAQHIRKLKAKLPEGDFKIVIQKPFVVVGDEDLATVEQRATRTVGWAAKKLKSVYFTEDPIHILDVWLFKDEESYNKNAVELFGRKPTTPFGYYSSTNRSLVMNISTGGGTLVHEIVHPFMESNFEDCPSWFNEGLASLYEQCREKNGKIWGSTNWRLRGLQLAIEDDRVPSFNELCSTTTDEFYNEDPGTNYSQARYLCYYLQEQGKLVEYYKTFRDNVDSDPTGIKTLRKVLGTDDLEQFQKDWQKYVMRLRF